MTPEVEQAIAEIKESFPGHTVTVTPEAQGGAYVIVDDLDIGPAFAPGTSWVGFLITFQYPRADVYPHFIDGSVSRKDDAALGQGFSATTWQDRRALQISRRSNRLDPTIDTAALKLQKVLEWLRTR